MFAWAVCAFFSRYHMDVQKTSGWYADWRATLDIDTVEYGVGGIQLWRLSFIVRERVAPGAEAQLAGSKYESPFVHAWSPPGSG